MLLQRPAVRAILAAFVLLPLGCAKEVKDGGSGGSVPADAGSGGSSSDHVGNVGKRSRSGTGGLDTGTQGLGKCPPPSGRRYECSELQLVAPPSVEQRFAEGAWDVSVMSGTMPPGTYVLTDLIQNGDKRSCSHDISAVVVFAADGRMSYRWDEAGVSNTFTARYTAGDRAGTLRYSIDCPKDLAGQASGIAFQATDTGFTMTYSDGLVHVFTRR